MGERDVIKVFALTKASSKLAAESTGGHSLSSAPYTTTFGTNGDTPANSSRNFETTSSSWLFTSKTMASPSYGLSGFKRFPNHLTHAAPFLNRLR
jgi:hypothetical protein